MSEESQYEFGKSFIDALNLDQLEAELKGNSSDGEGFDFTDYERFSNPANARPREDVATAEMQVGGDVKHDEDFSYESDYELYKKSMIKDEDIEANATRFYPSEKTYRSLLLDTFTADQVVELEKIQRTLSISNNQKIKIFREKLDEWGIDYNPIGGGTNRYAFMTDSYIIKIACDSDGKIDNKREFIYSIPLQPYVIKCYEIYGDGMMAVFEYVEAFTIDDFWKSSKKMADILANIGNQFLIGDVGIDQTNYVNWGFRDDQSIVILDYAYIYSVAFKQFTCSCSPTSMLYYNKDYTKLVCNTCGKVYTFREIRKKISKKDQEEEIGDLFKKGYVLTKKEEVKKFEPKFVLGAYGTIKAKLEKEIKKKGKILFNSGFSKRQDNKYDEPKELQDVISDIMSGDCDEALEQFK